MDLNLTERVSKQRSFSFPLRSWSLLNVVLLVIPNTAVLHHFQPKSIHRSTIECLILQSFHKTERSVGSTLQGMFKESTSGVRLRETRQDCSKVVWCLPTYRFLPDYFTRVSQGFLVSSSKFVQFREAYQGIVIVGYNAPPHLSVLILDRQTFW